MDPASHDLYFDVPGVASVRWDQDGQLVLVEWQGWANAAEFGELLEAEIEALRKHRGTRILADCRRQRVLNPADHDRANQEWVPRALAAGLKFFAVVVPSSVLADVNLRASLDKVPATALKVAYFDTPEQARD